ncbi:MAG: hypothetical protein HY617_03300 [Candidatus Sungbacteria bacterium]|nr:hypothetical protein [Candidatus Sungbacteria bacterium]
MKSNEMNTKKILTGLKQLPAVNYDGFDLDRLVVYTLLILEENKVPLYFDFIAVGLFRLFPHKFSMANFRQYPDTNRINKALRRLTDQKRKNWATGNLENGFYLTDLGREMAKQVSNSLKNPLPKKDRKPIVVSKSRGKSPSDDIQEIRVSEAFKKWFASEEVNNHEFFAFLKAAPYTPKQLLIEHLKRLKVSATTAKDKEVLEFLSWLEKKFSNLLS